MTTEEKVIAVARQAAEEAGDGSDRATMIVLARMALAGAHAAGSGFSRLPPGREVNLKLKGQVAIDDLPKQGK